MGGPRVFVSYAEENVSLVMRVAEVLRGAGFDPWTDRTHLEAGHELPPAIREALESSDLFLPLVTEEYVAKFERGAYVRREADWALAKLATLPGGEVFILPVRGGSEPAAPRKREDVRQLLEQFGFSFQSFDSPADEQGLVRSVFRALEGRGLLGMAIEVVAGPDRGAVFRKALSVITIGRADGNAIRLTDPAVSRTHAEIQIRKAAVLLRDTSGSHTAVRNAQRQERLAGTSARMFDGDLVTMGASELHITFNDVARLVATTTRKT